MATTMFLRHKVSDYAGWKQVYDSMEPLRKQHGVTSASVHHDINDPAMIVVTHHFGNAAAAVGFANSETLKEAMGNAGVISAPEFWFANDVEQITY